MKTATFDRATERTQDTVRVTTMKAIVQDKYGSADVLQLRDTDKPAIGEHDVLVRVRAAAVNPADWAIMGGLPYIARPAPMYGLRTPKNGIRGTDVAGQVEAVGSAVTLFRPGDDVFGWCRGGFAEYAAASEDWLAVKPANLTFEQAATLPMAGSVALQALRNHADVHVGQKVLVNGASGGIGTFAVQIAKSLGAEVTGVCSTSNVEMVRSIGADHVIDYTRDDFADGTHRYDLILDIAGNAAISRLRRALTPTGTAVMVGGEEGGRLTGGIDRQLRARIVSMFVRQRLTGLLCKERFSDLEFLAELIAAGELTPSVGTT